MGSKKQGSKKQGSKKQGSNKEDSNKEDSNKEDSNKVNSKEGRNRKSRIDLSTAAGRQLLRDLIQYKETGYNPFIPETYDTEKFWKSREVFQTVSFAAFKDQLPRMVSMAIAQMPAEERAQLEKEAREQKNISNKENVDQTDGNPKDPSNSKSKDNNQSQQHESAGQSLRDTLVCPHPNNDMAIVLFELGGDCDCEDSFQLEFSQDGRKICVYSKVPKEMQNAVALIGTKNANADQDADCMLLDGVIKERLHDLEEDENGNFWQPQEIIELPFVCHQQLFNKFRHPITSFLVRKNDQGYAWAYFWVLGQHVGKTIVPSSTIQGEASSVSSADSAVLLSSEDEMSIDSIQQNTYKQETEKRKYEQDTCPRTEMQQEIASLKEEIKNLKRQVEEKSTETASVIQEHESKLKTVNEQRNSSERELRAVIETQNQEMVQLRQENISKHNELENFHQQKSNEKKLREIIEKQKQEIVQLRQEKISKHNELEKLVDEHKSNEKRLHEMIEQQRQEGAQLMQQLNVQSDSESKLQLDHTHQLESQKHKIELLLKEVKEVKQKLRSEENKWKQLTKENKNLVKDHLETTEDLEERIEDQRQEIVKLERTRVRMKQENERQTLLLEKKTKEVNNLGIDIQTLSDKVAHLECERMRLANELLVTNDRFHEKEKIERQLHALIEEKQNEIDRLSSMCSPGGESKVGPIAGQNTSWNEPATNLHITEIVALAAGGSESFHKKHSCAQLTRVPNFGENANQKKSAPDVFEEKQPPEIIDRKHHSNINPLTTGLPETPKNCNKEFTTALIQCNANINFASTTQLLPTGESPKQAAMIDDDYHPNMNPLTTPLPESPRVSPDKESTTTLNQLNTNMNPFSTATPPPESPKVSNKEPVTNATTTTIFPHSPAVSDTNPPPKHLKQMKERRKRQSVSNSGDIEQSKQSNQVKERRKRKSVSNGDIQEPPTKRSREAGEQSVRVVRRSKRIQYRKRQVYRKRQQSLKQPVVPISFPLQNEEMKTSEEKGSSAAEECFIFAENVCTDIEVVATGGGAESNNEVGKQETWNMTYGLRESLD